MSGFNWTHPEFDDSDWPAAGVVWLGAPDVWPDTNSYWIGAGSFVVPPGAPTIYYRFDKGEWMWIMPSDPNPFPRFSLWRRHHEVTGRDAGAPSVNR